MSLFHRHIPSAVTGFAVGIGVQSTPPPDDDEEPESLDEDDEPLS